VDQYKAHLGAQGYSQKYGTNYDETFCLVVKLELLCSLIAIGVLNDLHILQIDVTIAFLDLWFKTITSLLKLCIRRPTEENWVYPKRK